MSPIQEDIVCPNYDRTVSVIDLQITFKCNEERSMWPSTSIGWNWTSMANIYVSSRGDYYQCTFSELMSSTQNTDAVTEKIESAAQQ
jgi:hypothetical protein